MSTEDSPAPWVVMLAASRVRPADDRDALILGGIVRHWLGHAYRFSPERCIRHSLDLVQEHKLTLTEPLQVEDVRRMARPFWTELQAIIR